MTYVTEAHERTPPLTRRWPWNFAAPPPLDCDWCGRRIGRRRWHRIVAGAFVICLRCADRRGRELHGALYPHCSESWHDLGDHALLLATRGGAWRVLIGESA